MWFGSQLLPSGIVVLMRESHVGHLYVLTSLLITEFHV